VFENGNKRRKGRVAGSHDGGRTYKRQMDSIRGQMQILETTMEELRGSLNALSALEEKQGGTEILVSIGSGSFIRAKLLETEKVIVGVGSALSLEKSVPEARSSLRTALSRRERPRKNESSCSRDYGSYPGAG